MKPQAREEPNHLKEPCASEGFYRTRKKDRPHSLPSPLIKPMSSGDERATAVNILQGCRNFQPVSRKDHLCDETICEKHLVHKQILGLQDTRPGSKTPQIQARVWTSPL